MEVIAVSKSARVAPRKVRLVADAIRKLSIEDALKALSILKNRGGQPLEKTLKSAIAKTAAATSAAAENIIINIFFLFILL